MSLAEILAEVDRLTDAERAELARRLRAHELASDPARTAALSARLDRLQGGTGGVPEKELRGRLQDRGLPTG